jgi:hypothetical protein
MKMIFKTFVVSVSALLVTAGCSKKSYTIAPSSENLVQGNLTNTKVDIILMIDNSSSMNVRQQLLSDQIPSMISTLDAAGLDYHIGVTTSDMSTSGSGGYFIGAGTANNPTYITPQTPNGLQLLQNRVKAGENGSDYERGIESVQSAIQNALDPAANNPDKGFWRDDAILSLIFLSDEEDQSTTTTVADFQKFMDQLKRPFATGQRSWIANFLGVLSLTSGCTAGPFSYPSPGYRYMQLADYSGGVKESICTGSLQAAVQNLKVQIINALKDFHLPRIPVVGSIKVYKEGLLVPESKTDGWEFIPTGNIIRFHGTAVPNSNEKIHVDFTPAEAN